jgi:transcriptional regulator with XRE-family HTH domain
MRNEPGEQQARERMGTNLRELRESVGLSRRELAERAELDPRTIKTLEEGARWPEFLTIALLCRGFRCDVGPLLGKGFRWQPDRNGSGTWIIDPSEADSQAETGGQAGDQHA